MTYRVLARELKWAGETLLKGAVVEPKSDRDHQHLALLVKIGKVEAAPDMKPVGRAATVKAPETVAPDPVPPAPVADQDAEPDPADPSPAPDASAPGGAYRTRRLKSEG